MIYERLRVFVSSRMQELAPERAAMRAALGELNIDGWVFEENTGARPQGIQQTYKEETDIRAYCLMPNHVHLVMVPHQEDGLRSAPGECHRRYTRHIHFREGWRVHLWQERFHSFVMDKEYLLVTVQYVERNPASAGLCKYPEQWRWSSARASQL